MRKAITNITPTQKKVKAPHTTPLTPATDPNKPPKKVEKRIRGVEQNQRTK